MDIDLATPGELIAVKKNPPTSKTFAPPSNLELLPHTTRWALVAVGTCSLASFLSTFALFSLLSYRLFTWRMHYKAFLGFNQYVVLFMNLIFADLCQASAGVISFYWIEKDGILAPTAVCAAQGFFLNFGNLAAAFWVLAIAVHTFVTAALRIRIPYSVFNALIWLLWLFALILNTLGLAIHREAYFARAGLWCGISAQYQTEMFALSYTWMLICMIGVIAAYLATFFKLRKKTSQLFAEQRRNNTQLANQNSVDAVKRVTKLMMLYPVVYLLLLIPAGVTLMWASTHDGQLVSDAILGIVESLIASFGWVDCLLYTLTRKRLMRESMRVNVCSNGFIRLQHDPEARGADNTPSEQRPNPWSPEVSQNPPKTLLQRFSASISNAASFLGIYTKKPKGITRTTTITISSDAFDASNSMPMRACVWSEISGGSRKLHRSGSERRADQMTEGPDYTRSPSPQRFAELGFAPSGLTIAPPRPGPKSPARKLEHPVGQRSPSPQGFAGLEFARSGEAVATPVLSLGSPTSPVSPISPMSPTSKTGEPVFWRSPTPQRSTGPGFACCGETVTPLHPPPKSSARENKNPVYELSASPQRSADLKSTHSGETIPPPVPPKSPRHQKSFSAGAARELPVSPVSRRRSI